MLCAICLTQLRTPSCAGTGLVGVDGQPLVLKGINWFGYEVCVSSAMKTHR